MRTAYQYGANGFVTKDKSSEVVIDALVQVALNGKFIAQEYQDLLFRAPRETLTIREIEILKLAPKLLSRQQIADQLGIKKRTVRYYIENISRKLGMRKYSRLPDLYVKAVEQGLIALS